LWQALSGRSFSSAVGGPPKPDHSRLVPKIDDVHLNIFQKSKKKFFSAKLVLSCLQQDSY
jgi:hypothetical protein